MLNDYIVAQHYLDNIVRDDSNSCWLSYSTIEKKTISYKDGNTEEDYKFRGLQSILTLIARRYIFHGEDINDILPIEQATSIENILYARDRCRDWCLSENSQWATFLRCYCEQKNAKMKNTFKRLEYNSVKYKFVSYINKKIKQNSDGTISNITGMYYHKGNDQRNYMKSWYMDTIIADALQQGELKSYSIDMPPALKEQIRLSNQGKAGFKRKQSELVDMITDIIRYVLTHSTCNGYAHIEFQDFINWYDRPNRHDIERIKNAEIVIDEQRHTIFAEKKLEILDRTLIQINPLVLEYINKCH